MVSQEMIRTFILLMFWLSFGLLFYVYLGFPLFLFLFAKSRRGQTHPERPLPFVTLLISAYNESAVIGQKLANSLSLDYPKELLQIIVISDCSDDGTDEIVGTYVSNGIQLVRQMERRGKAAGLNLGLQEAKGEILVFSDANAIYQSDAVRRLVVHFGDPAAGYVVGSARYRDSEDQVSSADSEGLYWKFESWVKERESNFGSVVGGDGALYAIRRQLYEPLRPTDINDLLHPLQIILKGYRGIYEPEAICHETAGDSFEKEFRRKVRIVSRSCNAVRRAWPVLLPWNQFRHWLCLISHKLFRWAAPFFLLVLAVSSIPLWSSMFYRVIVLLQLFFYFLAVIGWFTKGRGPRLVYLPYYFCVVNLASFLGLLKSFGGSLSSTWQTVRHEESAPTADTDPLARREF
jgi:cellulose synthase/poly-beta-1,6-N-acetylglucosamine synthase-like glycosyltransferase